MEIPEIEVSDSVVLDSDNSLLLVVDMQKDFAEEGGALYNPDAEETIPQISSLVRHFRRHGVEVAWTKDTHEEDSEEFEMFPPHCINGTEGHDLVDGLSRQAPEEVFEKSRYDATYRTSLTQYLDVNEIQTPSTAETIVVVGTVANICVHYTAASLGLRYYDIVLPKNGISALSEFGMHSSLYQSQFLFGAEVVEEGSDILFEEQIQ